MSCSTVASLNSPDGCLVRSKQPSKALILELAGCLGCRARERLVIDYVNVNATSDTVA